MNIGINCYLVNPAYHGGVNTYTLGLIDAFAAVGEKHKFQIYANKANSFLFSKYARFPNFTIILVPFPPARKFIRNGIRLFSICTCSTKAECMMVDFFFKDIAAAMDDNSDIVHTPTTVLFPYTFRKPTLLSMHDIQQVHYPQFFSRTVLRNREITFTLSAEKTTYMQASSEFIKQDLLSYFKCLRPEQIAVIPEGVIIEEFSKKRNIDEVIKKYNIPRDFLFFPAQLWHHKNHITVLKALNNLHRQYGLKLPLVLTGAQYSASEHIFRYLKENMMDYIYYLGKVPFEDLVVLYQNARFLITAVLYESSSLPILEAAAAGCPIIASDTPPNREMSNILKIELFEPLNEMALAELLKRVWDDPINRQKQIRHNTEHIKYYRWENAARKYLDFLEARIRT